MFILAVVMYNVHHHHHHHHRRYDCAVVCQMMSKRTLVTLGVVDESTLGTVDSFTRTFHMPFVTTAVPPWNVSTRLAGRYPLYLRPSYDEALLSLVRHYNWTHILYVYDNDAGTARRIRTFLRL